MGIIIGELKNGDNVTISDRSPNQHMALFGISGSGKSTRIKEILLSLHENNDTVIVFDISGMDFYPKGSVEGLDEGHLNRISAMDDRINLRLLRDGQHGDRIKAFNEADYISSIISGTLRLGDQQAGALRAAVIYAIDNIGGFRSEMHAISAGLEKQDTPISRSLSNKMGGILQCGILDDAGKGIENGKVNVISFRQITPSIQKNLIEIVLASIWRMVRDESSSMGKTAIIIDEFQNICTKEGSTLLNMLRESRKFGVGMTLATQTISSFPKEIRAVINQTAVQLYFKPSVSDISSMASLIDHANAKRWKAELNRLRVGESIATGAICVRGMEVSSPITIQSHYT